MKRKSTFLIGTLLSVCVSENAFSQSDIVGTGGTGHIRANGYYVGWGNTSGTSGSLDIRNAFSGQPILFQTGLSGGNPINRMKLNGDVNYDINGIGSAARNGYLPPLSQV